jgi:O-antigen ligase
LLLALIVVASVLWFGGAETSAAHALFSVTFGLLAWVAAQAWRRGERLVVPPIALPLLALTLWTWAQLLLKDAPHWADAHRAAWRWTHWAALLWLAAHLLGGRRMQRTVIVWLAGGGAALAAAAVIAHSLAPGRWFGLTGVAGNRPLGSFVNPDHWAAFAELALPAALWLHARAARPGWPLLATALLYGSAVVSASRAGVALATLQLLVLPLWMARRAAPPAGGGSLLRRQGAVMAAAALGAAVCGWDLFWRRAQDLDPLHHRLDIYASAWRLWMENFWTGAGAGSFETLYPAVARFDTALRVDHAHCDWLEWAAEGGVLAVLLLAWFVVRALMLIVRRGPWAAGVASVFLHAAVDFPLQLPGLYAPALCALGALAGASGDEAHPSAAPAVRASETSMERNPASAATADPAGVTAGASRPRP